MASLKRRNCFTSGSAWEKGREREGEREYMMGRRESVNVEKREGVFEGERECG